MNKTLSISIVVIFLIILGGIIFFTRGENRLTTEDGGENSTSQTQNDKQQFDKTPDFRLKDTKGNEVALSDFDGKVRVINSWAAWCPFCVDELSDFAQLQEEFGDTIVVIAINRKESLNKTQQFTDELGVTDGMLFLLDPKDSFYQSIGGFSMPETLFIDEDGNIRIHKRGPMRFLEMKEKVESIITSS